MQFEERFPLVLYLNLSKHDQRRWEVEHELLQAGINNYVRVPAYAGKWFRDPRGYPTVLRYAQALTHKRAVLEGWRRRMSAVLIVEDDVVFRPDFRQFAENLSLPDDWAIALFGCQHRQRPEIASSGVVRCKQIWDLHAYAVRATAYRAVARALTPIAKGQQLTASVKLHSCDEQISQLCEAFPVYAAWPNLAWQRDSISEAQKDWRNDNYTPEGRQRYYLDSVAGLDKEMQQKYPDAKARMPIARRHIPPPKEADFYLNWYSQLDVGLGDRLRGLVGMKVLSAMQCKTLRLWWKSGTAMPGKHAEALEPVGYEVVEDERVWRNLTKEVFVDSTPSNIMPEEAWRLALERGLANEECKEEFMREWKKTARQLRPAQRVLNRIDGIWKQWRCRRPLGVHVRRTDVLNDDRKAISVATCPAYDAALMQEVQTLISTGWFDGIFLSVDNETSEAQWQKWFADAKLPLLHVDRVWRAGHLRRTSLEDAAVDLFTLARCDTILASIWSSFSWIASEIGDARYIIAPPPLDQVQLT